MAQNTEGQKEPYHNSQKNTRKLTLQQKIFCEMLVAMGPYAKAVKAAMKAGYKVPEKSVGDLMVKPEVLAYIEELRIGARMRNNITIDDLINEIAKIAFFDIRTCYDEFGQVKQIQDLDDIAAAAVAEANTAVTGLPGSIAGMVTETKIKVRDKLAAINALRDMLGYKQSEMKVIKDANGAIVATEETYTGESKVIFEDYSGKVKTDGGNLQI